MVPRGTTMRTGLELELVSSICTALAESKPFPMMESIWICPVRAA